MSILRIRQKSVSLINYGNYNPLIASYAYEFGFIFPLRKNVSAILQL